MTSLVLTRLGHWAGHGAKGPTGDKLFSKIASLQAFIESHARESSIESFQEKFVRLLRAPKGLEFHSHESPTADRKALYVPMMNIGAVDGNSLTIKKPTLTHLRREPG
jgi:hypothetical protein